MIVGRLTAAMADTGFSPQPVAAPGVDGDDRGEPDRLRLVFWNTFLLQPRPIPGGPGLPAIGELAAPAVADRAVAIGRALKNRFDVAALAEAFEAPDHERLVEAWGSSGLRTAKGPGRSLLRGPLGFASSGLFTITHGRRIVRERTLRFTQRGSYLHDADALANKGVLLVEIDLPRHEGNLELYSTHLCWGTGLVGGTVADDPVRRHRTRMEQLDELVAFVERTHRPANVAIVVGDMNVPALDPAYPDGPTAQYDDLTGRLGALDMEDLWPILGTGAGATCGAAVDAFADQRDPGDPDALSDRGGGPGADPRLVAERVRIDYVFLQTPRERHRVGVRAESMRRLAFPRPDNARARDRLARLSDHVALGVDLAVSGV